MLSASQLATLIRRRKVSARKVALVVIGWVGKWEGSLRAWAYFDPDRVVKQADRLGPPQQPTATEE
jgi:hypothetical protein